MYNRSKWSLIVCLLGLLMTSPTQADTPTVANLTGTNLSEEGRHIAHVIQRVFPDAPIMLHIANCESTGLIHREPDGSLLRNRDGSSARGVFQVLMRVHQDEFARLGLDPNNDEHYFRYARLLYEQNGTQPWNASRHCWNRYARRLS